MLESACDSLASQVRGSTLELDLGGASARPEVLRHVRRRHVRPGVPDRPVGPARDSGLSNRPPLIGTNFPQIWTPSPRTSFGSLPVGHQSEFLRGPGWIYPRNILGLAIATDMKTPVRRCR